MNKFSHIVLAILLLSLAACSSERPDITYLNEEYHEYYRVTDLTAQPFLPGAVLLIPSLKIVTNRTEEIRDYYGDAVIYTGRQFYFVRPLNFSTKYSPIQMSAIDWRVSSVDVIVKNPWNGFPEGSSVRDYFCLEYRFNDNLVTVPLSTFSLGDWGLTDNLNWTSIYPGFPTYEGITIGLLPEVKESVDVRSLQIDIKDAFGHSFSCAIE